MKTIIYIGITGVLLAAGTVSQAQLADSRSYRNDDAGIVINNYYNYDFYYSSRINRFHRSYATFSYYSPVFTDTYWYSYQPFTWGLTIYGGGRIGLGVSYNFPIYYSWDYPWYGGWDYAWYGGAWYWNYDPFYYNWWYSPVTINIRIGSWWPHTHYYSYNVRNRWYNDYRPVYNTYNYYYYNIHGGTGGSSSTISRRTTPPVTTTSGSINRREANTETGAGENAAGNRRVTPANSREGRGDMGNNNSLNPGNTDNVNRGVNSGNNPGRRNTPAGNTGNQGGNIHQGDQGNNNSANPGNTNNVNRRVNSGNNPGQGNANNNNQYNNRQVNQGQGNARPSVTTPSQDRRTYGTVTAPSRTTNPASGSTRSAAGGNTGVRESQRPVASPGNRVTISSGNRQSSGSSAVRSSQSSGRQSVTVSRPSSSRSTSVQKSESKSSSSKNSSGESNGSRRK